MISKITNLLDLIICQKKRIRKFEKLLDKEKVDENPYTNWELNKNLKQAYVEEINDVKASIKFVKKIYEK